LLTLTVRLLDVPTVMLPKLMLAGFTEICAVGDATPIPFSVIVSGAPATLLVIVSVPVTLPAPVGVNFTAIVAFCPGGTVIGSAAPTTLNPAPVMLTCVIVTAVVPLLVTVTFWVPLLPVVTLPKFTLVESGESCPELAPVTPHPVAARAPARASPSRIKPPCARQSRQPRVIFVRIALRRRLFISTHLV